MAESAHKIEIPTAESDELTRSDASEDEEFDFALKRASKKLDEMAAKALAEHRAGKTKKFPE